MQPALRSGAVESGDRGGAGNLLDRAVHRTAGAYSVFNHSIALARVLSVEAAIAERLPLLAARLHDTIEDTETTEAELVARSGPGVAATWRRTAGQVADRAAREYFDWARRVIDGLCGTHAPLEAIFDAAYALRP